MCACECLCTESQCRRDSGTHIAPGTLDTWVCILIILPLSHQLALGRSPCVQSLSSQTLLLLFLVAQLCLTLCDPWATAHQASLAFTISLSLLKLTSIASVIPSNHLILCRPLLFLSSTHSFPASGSFPVSQLFASGGQNTGASASASVLPMGFQG